MTALTELRAGLARAAQPPDAATVSSAVARGSTAQGWRSILALESQARAELVGAGDLQSLLEDPRVTDVLVNGAHGVWADRGSGLIRTGVDLGDEAARSEERRVGKEGRWRGAPEQERGERQVGVVEMEREDMHCARGCGTM